MRHASAVELAAVLDRVNASDTLKEAVAAGDSSLLSREFGNNPRTEPQISHFPGHEDEKPAQEESEPGEDQEQGTLKPASAS